MVFLQSSLSSLFFFPLKPLLNHLIFHSVLQSKENWKTIDVDTELKNEFTQNNQKYKIIYYNSRRTNRKKQTNKQEAEIKILSSTFLKIFIELAAKAMLSVDCIKR